MSKNQLRQEQEVFDGEAVVDEAAHWAEALLQRAYRGPGDTIEAATYRAEQKYGVPAQNLLGAPVSEAEGHSSEHLSDAPISLRGRMRTAGSETTA